MSTHLEALSPDAVLTRLRLLSYNIQVAIPYHRYRHYVTRSWRHVLPFRGRAGALEAIARFIRPFDLVGLQELDIGSLRSGYVNQAHYLAQRGGFPYCAAHVTRDLGHVARHGMALLSRVAPREVAGHRLPGRIPGRAALAAEFGEGAEPLLVLVVHLALGRRARRRQVDYLAAQVRERRHAIVMGDFNCRREDPEFQRLLATTHLCAPQEEHATHPSWRPRRALDHILVTPEITVTRSEVIRVTHSDHLPIALEVGVPAAVGLRAARAPGAARGAAAAGG